MRHPTEILVRTSVRLPQQDIDKVKRIANRQGTYPADVIRNLLKTKLEEIEA